MVKYEALYFDLDHTLWDYEANSKDTLAEIFTMHIEPRTEAGLDNFIRDFGKVNDELWDLYNKGKIEKEVIREERFHRILTMSGVDDTGLSAVVSEHYLFECPRKTQLMPHALDILDYLANKYEMHILTNGFTDVQKIKMDCAGISGYFDQVITSEASGHKKPSIEFFDYALELTKSTKDQVVMIGDNLATDIAGAHKAAIDSVYFNPSGYAKPHKANFEISCLSELTDIL